MKSTIRVHRNDVAKQGKSQAKIRAKNTIEQSVVLIFRGEAGKMAAEVEVPKSVHAAMLRDAKAKGISLLKWVENAVRIICSKELVGGAH
jgi:predicted HicB family RNase H-like nuclease